VKMDVKNVHQSIHDKLRNKARHSGRPFQEMLEYYAIERFLYRLSQSEHSNKFVLKGALIILAWGVPLRRPTRDIDLRAFTENDIENLVGIITEICNQTVDQDGMLYDPESISATRIIEDADYQGLRIRLWAYLGKAKVPLQVDLVFADEITPSKIFVEYPTILELPPPKLFGYPRESVIAEKLQAMVFLGVMNSRMKDFYDLWLLSTKFNFTGSSLMPAILQTFNNRGTEIPDAVPDALSMKFAQDKQIEWSAFLRRSGYDQEDILDFGVVIESLKKFLLPPLLAAARQEPFHKSWKEAGSWT